MASIDRTSSDLPNKKSIFQRFSQLSPNEVGKVESIAREITQNSDESEAFGTSLRNWADSADNISSEENLRRDRLLAVFYDHAPDALKNVILNHRYAAITHACRLLHIPFQVKDVLTDERVRIDLLKQCLSRKITSRTIAEDFLKNPQNFGIWDQNSLIELTTIGAQQHSRLVLEYIERFPIQDPATLLKIALICAEKEAVLTMDSIQNFHLENQGRLEVALVCAKRNPEKTAQNIGRFYLEDEESRMRVALVCAQGDALEVARSVNNFGITDRKMRKDLFLACVIRDPSSLQYIENPTFQLFAEMIRMDTEERWNQGEVEKALKEWIEQHLPLCKFEWVQDYISMIHDPHTKRQITVFLIASLFILKEELSEKQIQFANTENLICSIFELKAPHLCLSLVSDLTQFLKDEPTQKIFDGISPLKWEGYTWFKLVRVSLARLQAEGIENKIIDQLREHLNRREFRDLTRARHLIHTLSRLACSRELNKNEKNRLLFFLIHSPQDLVSNLSCLEILFDCEKVFLLRGDIKDLNALVLEAMKELRISKIDHFNRRFAETFGSSRNPLAIWGYLAKMMSLHDPRILECLEDFIEGVLIGRFREMRYDPSSNPHLKKISENYPGLIEKWRRLTRLKTIDPSFYVAITDDPFDLLFCGEITGSCLHLDGNPSENRGLLGYIMNAQTMPIIVCATETGKLLGRGILRLLLDKEGKPVLFLEKYYGLPKYQDFVLACAKKKAQNLGLPLTALQNIPEGSPYPSSLYSLGGRAPYEYFDAVNSIAFESTTEIQSPQLISQ